MPSPSRLPDAARPAVVMLAALSAWLLLGCETETDVLYGEPDRVTGGTGVSAAASSSSGGCTPDPACEVSWETDVFPLFQDGIGACGAAGCHAVETSGLAFPDDAAAARQALLDYVFQGSAAYVAPCDAEASRLLCNLRVPASAESPFGSCGSLMPKSIASDAADDRPLTLQEVATVEAWIECGAPDN